MEKTEPSYSVGSSNPTPGHISRETIICQNTCTPMFIVALLTIAMTWKKPKYPLTDEQLKMWYIRGMEYYSAIEKNEMPFATTQMDLKIFILIEVSQKEKHEHHMISLIWGI